MFQVIASITSNYASSFNVYPGDVVIKNQFLCREVEEVLKKNFTEHLSFDYFIFVQLQQQNTRNIFVS